MKTASRTLASLAALTTVATAAPFLAVGDSAELFFTGVVGIRADDNILLASNKTDDIIFVVNPGLELVYGNGTLNQGRVSYVESFTQYSDNSYLNNNLSALRLDGKYDDEKTSLAYKAGFAQLAQNTYDARIVDGLVRKDVSNLGATAEVSLTEKSSVEVGADFQDTNYKRVGFIDTQITSVPVNYFYQMSPKADFGFGISYKENNLKNNDDSKDYFYNVSARGEFTPKLSGKIAVGYVTRDFRKSGSEESFGILSSLSYAVNEKTSVNFGVNNDFDVSGQGATQRNLAFNLGLQSKVAADWTFGSNLSYKKITYFGTSGRTDSFLDFGLNGTYIINAAVNVTGSYSYRKYDSKIAGADFNNNVFSVVANLRY